MATATLAPLPPYPSSHTRSQLSHTQLASLNQKISLSIQQTLDLPTQVLHSAAPAAFICSYAHDVAQNNLDALIWDVNSKAKPRSETSEVRTIRARTLLLAERLASAGMLDPATLLDLSVAYASQPTRLRALFDSAFSRSPSLLASITASALPAFTSILRSHTTTGLHGIRKVTHVILSLLRVSPPDLLRAFARSRDFVLSLAQAYDAGLRTAASSYGRLYIPAAGVPHREPDDWEVLFLQTKVDLLDAFHILVTALLNALAALPQADPSFVAETERACDILSALHSLSPPPRRPDDHPPPTTFLNRSLLADYQYTYDLSDKLVHALPHGAAANDARLKWLPTALRELEADLNGGSSGPPCDRQGPRRDPGAFKLLLGPGVLHGIHHPVLFDAARASEDAVAAPTASAEAPMASSSRAVDPRVEEVCTILPNYTPEYVEALLQRAEYGSVEHVVEALLEGTAPPPEAIQQQATLNAQTPQAREEFEYTRDRWNVFDGEDMDVSRLTVGKKSDDAMTVLRDRSFMDRMKLDILRRVEASTDSEDDEVDVFGVASDRAKGKGKVREVAFDDELEDIGSVRVAGDGEESSADDDEDGREEPEMTPQTIVELAYIANPKAFDRDAATRRSKERAALRAQTGWVDEQIEGFRIMLDRDPKLKEKTLARHEFAGNKPFQTPLSGQNSRSRSGTPDAQPARGRGESGSGRRGQVRGHSRGHGRGRGRGGTRGSETVGGGGSADGGDARSHAWKAKNKARQANHDRKRGHDRKMRRAGGPSGGQ
ncbi:hypothetical protein F5148DRAFT_1203796 [Russula earlei]|uniref:Uncharacterized protein n=1 Tax=Russula earlei TaxID=71964 RepID=A0ACC0U7C6_9AGAM|nr:hypothetical protein F5148DRAFT_1203796 [Russula earlei]